MAVPRSGNTPTQSAALGFGYLRSGSRTAACGACGVLPGAIAVFVVVDPGLRVERRRACGAPRCPRATPPPPRGGSSACSLSLAASAAFASASASAARAFAAVSSASASRLSTFCDVGGDVLADPLGLDVPALVTPAARGENQRRDHDDRHDCDDDPNDGGAIHGGSFRGKSRAVVDAPANSDSLRRSCRNAAPAHRAHVDFGRLLH